MKSIRRVLCVCALAALAGCQTVPQQAVVPESEPAAPQAGRATDTRPGRPESSRVIEQLQPMLERLSGQQLKQQEQLLNMSSKYAQLATTMDQAVMLLKQQQARMVSPKSQPQGDDTGAQQAEFEQMMDQVIAMLNDQGGSVTPAPGGRFGVASAYTGKGQWVLVRFDRRSGETWLADQGRWQPLQDSPQALESGDYRVIVLRADQDVKGYVATRIDQRSGTTWWLRQNTWQKFSSQ